MAEGGAAVARQAHAYVPGETVFLLSSKWWHRFTRAAGDAGPIDNSNLVVGAIPRPGIRTPQDYTWVPSSVWASLMAQFGGGPIIPAVLSDALVPVIDFRVIPVTHCATAELATFTVVATTTIAALTDMACEKWQITGKARLRSFWQNSPQEILRADATLDAAHVYFLKPLLLEIQNPDGTWPSLACLLGSGAKMQGVKGLPNIGNSCYMNAVLQCLVHSQLFFNHYFTANSNQLPMGDRVSAVFGRFLNRYWRVGKPGDEEIRMLYQFKTLSDLKYTTWEQQDAHEFLSDLLTALEKDGNTLPSQIPAPDFSSADSFWAYQRILNTAPVFEFVSGVVSTELRCDRCGSTTAPRFELSETIGLPIVEQNVTVIPSDRGLPAVSLSIVVARATLSDFQAAVAAQIRAEYPQIRPEFVFAICDEARHRLALTVDFLTSFTLLAFEIPDRAQRYFVVAPVVSRSSSTIRPFLCAAPSGADIATAVRGDLSELWEVPPDDFLLSVDDLLLGIHPDYPLVYEGVVQIVIDGALLTPAYGVRQALLHGKVAVGPPDARVPLTDYLLALTEPAVFDAENAWECPVCEQKVSAEKQTKIWRLPPLLIIQLGRFGQGGIARTKVKANIVFDDVLDMERYVESREGGGLRYRLFAVIEHLGDSLDVGHHQACAKNHRLNVWHRYSDDQPCVELDSPAQYRTRNAYVLFYEKIEDD
jgi:ubiquitin C-terminal hydrolase